MEGIAEMLSKKLAILMLPFSLTKNPARRIPANESKIKNQSPKF